MSSPNAHELSRPLVCIFSVLCNTPLSLAYTICSISVVLDLGSHFLVRRSLYPWLASQMIYIVCLLYSPLRRTCLPAGLNTYRGEDACEDRRRTRAPLRCSRIWTSTMSRSPLRYLEALDLPRALTVCRKESREPERARQLRPVCARWRPSSPRRLARPNLARFSSARRRTRICDCKALRAPTGSASRK